MAGKGMDGEKNGREKDGKWRETGKILRRVGERRDGWWPAKSLRRCPGLILKNAQTTTSSFIFHQIAFYRFSSSFIFHHLSSSFIFHKMSFHKILFQYNNTDYNK